MVENKDLSAIIEQIYDAGLGEGRWDGAMESVRAFIGAETFHLHVRDERQGTARSIATSFSESFKRKYVEHWWRFDIRVRALRVAPMGRVHIGANLIDTSEYLQSPIYNELARPEGGAVHMLLGEFSIDPMEHALIGLHRNIRQREFTERQRQQLNLLTPHIVRSLRLRRLTERMRGHDGAVAAFEHNQEPHYVVDEKARVIKANSAGEALLAKGEILQCTRSGGLATSRPIKTNQLRRLIAVTATPRLSIGPGLIEPGSIEDNFIAFEVEDGSVIAIAVSRLPGQRSLLSGDSADLVLVTVRDPRRLSTASAALLRKLHGLTETEAAIATDVAAGKTLEEISTARGVRLSTVRWHLKSIFSKTGSGRQADITRLITGYQRL